MSIDRLGTKSGYHGWRGGLTLEFMRMTAPPSPVGSKVPQALGRAMLFRFLQAGTATTIL